MGNCYASQCGKEGKALFALNKALSFIIIKYISLRAKLPKAFKPWFLAGRVHGETYAPSIAKRRASDLTYNAGPALFFA